MKALNNVLILVALVVLTSVLTVAFTSTLIGFASLLLPLVTLIGFTFLVVCFIVENETETQDEIQDTTVHAVLKNGAVVCLYADYYNANKSVINQNNPYNSCNL